jgi:hypothetical protein
MNAAADKYGFAALKDDVNFIAGWVTGQMVAEVLVKTGPEPTREKLVAYMDKGFEIDTKGVSAPIKFTKDDHRGMVTLRPYSYDYQAKKFVAHGKYTDNQKFVK